MLSLSLIKELRSIKNVGRTIPKHCRRFPTRYSSSLTHCLNLVKKFDYENFLCTLLLPNDLKATAFAVRAFNIEVARIQEQAVKRHKLSKLFLKRLISVRAQHLNRSTFRSIQEMETYADQTNTPIYMLLLEASGIKDIDCDHAAAHLGTAQGVANLIRGLQYNVNEQLIMLPMPILIKHNVSEESMIRMTLPQTALQEILWDVASVAVKHLTVVKSLEHKIPQSHKSIFLPAVPLKKFLNRLEKCDFNIRALAYRDGLLPISLSWCKLRGTLGF